MQVPLFSVEQQHQHLESELKAAFEAVLSSNQFVLGDYVARFERECAAALGVRHVLGVSSGTDALLLALMALGIGQGDEVLCPTFTFFATAGAIARLGAKPVFVDVDLHTFNIDLEDVQAKQTPRTKAIIPVHLYGQGADMAGLMQLARANGWHVLEDAAQSFTGKYHGRALGTIGDFGAYSFYPTKNLGALGDAGLLVTNDDALAKRATLLRTHGSAVRYYHEYVGGNFRLDGLQGAFLSVKLQHLPRFIEQRRSHAAFYTQALLQDAAIGLNATGANQRILLPAATQDHIWHQYTVRVMEPGQRDALRDFLKARGIGTEVYYPLCLHQQQCFQDSTVVQCPNAEQLSQTVLSLPMYPELSSQQLEYVVQGIREFLAT